MIELCQLKANILYINKLIQQQNKRPEAESSSLINTTNNTALWQKQC